MQRQLSLTMTLSLVQLAIFDGWCVGVDGVARTSKSNSDGHIESCEVEIGSYIPGSSKSKILFVLGDNDCYTALKKQARGDKRLIISEVMRKRSKPTHKAHIRSPRNTLLQAMILKDVGEGILDGILVTSSLRHESDKPASNTRTGAKSTQVRMDKHKCRQVSALVHDA